MQFPYVAASVAAILIVLQQGLMLNTGLHRARTGIGVGTGADLHLERKIRRHGNLAENSAIFILVLALAEMLNPTSLVIVILGGVFVVARVSHAVAFSSLTGSHGSEDGSKVVVAARVVGSSGTALGGIVLGGYLGYLLLTMA